MRNKCGNLPCVHSVSHSVNIGRTELGSTVPGAGLLQRQINLGLKEPGPTAFWVGGSITQRAMLSLAVDGLATPRSARQLCV